MGQRHQNLIDLAKVFGASPEGMCRGLTMRWIEAAFLYEETTYDKRINIINKDIRTLQASVDKFVESIPKKSAEIGSLYDLHAFLDSAAQFQITPSSFVAAPDLVQHSIKELSQIASSDEILKLGGLDIFANNLRLFTEIEFSNYLNEVRDLIDGSNHSGRICISLNTHDHATGLFYEKGKGWKFMDINNDEAPLTDPDEISQWLFEMYANNSSQIGLNLEFINTINNRPPEPLITKLVELQENYNKSITDKIAKAKWGGDANLLWMAVHYHHLELAQQLIDNGADVTLKPIGFKNSIIWSAFYFDSPGRSELICKLINQGADLGPHHQGETLMVKAAKHGEVDILKALITKQGKTEINTASSFKNLTPLLAACRSGHLNVVKYLVSLGVDVNIPSSEGDFPLELACVSGKVELVHYLLGKGAKVSTEILTPNETITSLFGLALINGNFNLIEYFGNLGLVDINQTWATPADILKTLPNNKASADRMKDFLQKAKKNAKGFILYQAVDIARILDNQDAIYYLTTGKSKKTAGQALKPVTAPPKPVPKTTPAPEPAAPKPEPIPKQDPSPVRKPVEIKLPETKESKPEPKIETPEPEPFEEPILPEPEKPKRPKAKPPKFFTKPVKLKPLKPQPSLPQVKQKPDAPNPIKLQPKILATMFFKQEPSELIEKLEKYVSKRKKENKFHHDFLGFISLLYLIESKLMTKGYFKAKHRDTKISAASKLIAILKGHSDASLKLSEAEIEACNDGLLSKIISKYSLDIEELQNSLSEYRP